MARPKNRYARAQARARYRKPKRRSSSLGWNVAIAAIVLLGVGGIIVSRSGEGSAAPAIGDHWHARLAVNVCGEFAPNAPQFEGGIHTHADGFMHIHPFSSAESGENATIATFMAGGGWDVSEDSFELWPGADSKRNGDACTAADGTEQPGKVRWSVNGRERKGNPGDYRPQDGDVIVLAFLPEGQEIPPPPEADQAQDTVTPSG
jgi:hypothetical protein